MSSRATLMGSASLHPVTRVALAAILLVGFVTAITDAAPASATASQPAATKPAATQPARVIKQPLPAWAEELRVLPEVLYTYTGHGRPTPVNALNMVHYNQMVAINKALAKYDQDFDRMLNDNKVAEYAQQKRQQFLDLIGPLPEKTPLNAQVTGTIQKDGYKIEKILFQLDQGRYMSANLYLPATPPPYPAVLVPAGHTQNGKAGASYQRFSILLAKNGIAALAYDPVDQGERHQIMPYKNEWVSGELGSGSGGYGHNYLWVNSALIGHSSAKWWVWDGIRCVDYLQSRPDIDPERIGCSGNSGGGTATTYVMAVEPRIKVAGPSCFICSMRALMERNIASDGEQQIFGCLTTGLGPAEFIIMRAPQPTIISAAYRDEYFPILGTWETFRRAKQAYIALGHSERVDMAESRLPHGFTQPLRLAVARWMRRWLMQMDDAKIVENGEEPILKTEELLCSPKGEVMLMDGTRNAFDWNRAFQKTLVDHRKELWSEDTAKALAEVRRVTGIRKLSDLKKPEVTTVGTVQRDGYRIDRLILQPELTLYLPALAYVPAKPSGQAYLYLHQDGKFADAAAGGPIEKLVAQNHTVLAVDLSGIGETEVMEGKAYWSWFEPFGHGYSDNFNAAQLGTSTLAARAEQVVVCARFLANYPKGQKDSPVHVISIGRTGPAVLHAAALEPQLFQSVTLKRSLASWVDVVNTPLANNQMVNVVFGALKVYDLPDLLASLPKEKVTVIEPLDAMEKPLAVKDVSGPNAN